MSKAKRYDKKQKLNIKKVFGVVIFILVIIMVIVSITKLLKGNKDITGKATTKYFTIYYNGKYGVIDNQGNYIISAKYNEMIYIPNNEKAIFVYTENIDDTTGTYVTRVIDNKGTPLYTNYDKVELVENFDSNYDIWYEDVLRVSKSEKYGLIDLDGNELLPCEYSEITSLKGVQGNIIVKKDDKVGLVNIQGQPIINTEYKEITKIKDNYNSQYIVMNENGQYGIIGTNGKALIEVKYEQVKYVNNNTEFLAKEAGTWKLINTNNETLLETGFDDITETKGDTIIFIKDGKYGVMAKSGETKITTEYEELRYAFSIYYIAKKDGKFGVINIENTPIISFEYNNITYIEEAGLLKAEKNEQETVIYDNTLSEKFTGIITEINKEKGYIRVRANDEYNYYNFKFEEKANTDILTINTLFLSKKDGKYGYINKSGDVVVDYKYDDAKEQNQYGYCVVKSGNLWGCLDQTGKVVLEPSVNLDNSIKQEFIGKWHLSDDELYYIN